MTVTKLMTVPYIRHSNEHSVPPTCRSPLQRVTSKITGDNSAKCQD